MKILTPFLKYDYGVASRGPSVEASIWIPAFQKAGFDVVPFFLEDHGFPGDLSGLQERLIDRAKFEKPDFVFFILMRDEITFDTLDQLNCFTKTINWFCDDQWRFQDFSLPLSQHLGHCLTVDKYCVQKYLDNNVKHVELVHWCPPFEIGSLVPPDRYEFDVSFIGGRNYSREWVIEELRNAGIQVHCFGQGWEGGKVSFERMREIFLHSKINLNLSNSAPQELRFRDYWIRKRSEELRRTRRESSNPIEKLRIDWELYQVARGRNLKLPDLSKNQEQVKARNFEIAGSGGFQISKMAPGLEDFYRIGEEIAVYNTVEELVMLIDYYKKNDRIRLEVARKGLERTRSYQLPDHLREIIDRLRKCV